MERSDHMMRFHGEDASLDLEIVSYEFPPDEGEAGSDDRNWLVLRATYRDEDGEIVKDSNSCLLTYELREMTAGLKVLRSGVRDRYESSFVEPYFELEAELDGEDSFRIDVSFYLPNSMDGNDTAEVECRMDRQQLSELIEELERLSEKYPDRL